MKLSLRKRFGYVHVHGGRVLRVVHPHGVPTSTVTYNKQEPKVRSFIGTVVQCAEGDLAIEIVAAKTGNVLGYSYLSGPALQLNNYCGARADRFEEARSIYVNDLPHPQDFDDFGTFLPEIIERLMRLKYADDPYALVAIEYHDPQASDAANGLLQSFSYAPDEDDPPENRTHMMGIVHGEGKNIATMHCQPPCDADDYCATGFQIELVLSSMRTA